jgi:hypothetical protein
MTIEHNSPAANEAYDRYRAARRAESRREDCFYIGLSLAAPCIVVAAVDAALLTFGYGSWWLLGAMLLGLLTARLMIAPGFHRDGLGYRLTPVAYMLLWLLWLRNR